MAFALAPHGPDFTHQAWPTAAKQMFETMGSGVAVLDYDGDGDLDLFFLNGKPTTGSALGSPPALFRNDGRGNFQRAAVPGLQRPFYGMGCAVGDYDNDGDPDVYCTAVLGPAKLFRNDLRPTGKPGFTEVARQSGVDNGGRWGASAAWLDYDRDGRLDLFVCNYVRYRSLKDDLPCYSGDRVPTYCSPREYEGEPCRLYRNLGGGRFEEVSEATGILAQRGKSLGVVVWDFNEDGWPDIAVANDTEPLFLFLNQGGKRFRESAREWGVAVGPEGVARAGMGIDAASAPGPGELLTFTAFWGEGASLYRTVSDAEFADLSRPSGLANATRQSLGFGVRLFDANNDGDLEMLIANGHIQDNVERFQPQATFAQPPLLFTLHDGRARSLPLTGELAKPLVARGLATGDFNSDGRLDVVLTQRNRAARLWLNESPAAGHWLGIALEGVRSNRDGYGAEVRATAGGVTRRAYCRSGGSYLSASAPELRFGLGDATAVERVEIRWPSGVVDSLFNVPADQTIQVREGSGQVDAE